MSVDEDRISAYATDHLTFVLSFDVAPKQSGSSTKRLRIRHNDEEDSVGLGLWRQV